MVTRNHTHAPHPCTVVVRNRGPVGQCSQAPHRACIRFSMNWEFKQAMLWKITPQWGTKSWWNFFSLIVFEFCRNSAFSSRVCKTEKVKPAQEHHAGQALAPESCWRMVCKPRCLWKSPTPTSRLFLSFGERKVYFGPKHGTFQTMQNLERNCTCIPMHRQQNAAAE